jgi:hypothetical protein
MIKEDVVNDVINYIYHDVLKLKQENVIYKYDRYYITYVFITPKIYQSFRETAST